MPSLTGSVGGGGGNAVHDVALVKFMLMQIKGPAGSAYIPVGDYADPRDGNGSAAIRAFQQDNHLLDTDKSKPGASTPEVAGLVAAGGRTWAKLLAALPAAFKTVRTAAGVGLVYFPMNDAALKTATGEIEKSQLKPDFKRKVIDLMKRFHAQSGIAVTANPGGLRRSFADQMKKTTEASPGETIHNYGYAVDLGFTGLSYVSRAGRTEIVDAGDRGFDKWPRIKEQIWLS